MERLTVVINTENDVFDTDNTEIGRILRDLADKLEGPGIDETNAYDREIPLRDINGNQVGHARIR